MGYTLFGILVFVVGLTLVELSKATSPALPDMFASPLQCDAPRP